MLKNIFHKIRHNPLLMVLACVAPIIVIIGIFSLFKAGNNSWVWLFILLCPLAHFFMMKGHKHNHDEHDVRNNDEHIKKVEQKSQHSGHGGSCCH